MRLEAEIEQTYGPILFAVKHTHDVLLHQIVCLLADTAVALLATLKETCMQLDILVVSWQSVVEQESLKEVNFREELILHISHLTLKVFKNFLSVSRSQIFEVPPAVEHFYQVPVPQQDPLSDLLLTELHQNHHGFF